MTCRELALVQGFPFDFYFSGANTSTYRQIGSAVPMPLAYSVARQFNEYESVAGGK